jgi:hypothetical protein
MSEWLLPPLPGPKNVLGFWKATPAYVEAGSFIGSSVIM